MRVYGLDFTSAPTRRKPITCACCELQGSLLYMQTFYTFTDFAQFETFLAREESSIAALDFPFGLPRRLISALHWPANWQQYVQHISSLGKAGFAEALKRYQATRPPGDKLHLRATDIVAGARSPMMMQRVPVGKMFFEGAPRLLASGASILPCRPSASSRIVIEGYPTLVVRKCLSKLAYKSDERKKQTPEHLYARQRLVAAILSQELTTLYSISLDVSDEQANMLIQDPMGDLLDALLCAIQAAWAYLQRACEQRPYGIPPGHEVEGWIVDPIILSKRSV